MNRKLILLISVVLYLFTFQKVIAGGISGGYTGDDKKNRRTIPVIEIEEEEDSKD